MSSGICPHLHLGSNRPTFKMCSYCMNDWETKVDDLESQLAEVKQLMYEIPDYTLRLRLAYILGEPS